MLSAMMDSTEDAEQQNLTANTGEDIQPSTNDMGGAPTEPGVA